MATVFFAEAAFFATVFFTAFFFLATVFFATAAFFATVFFTAFFFLATVFFAAAFFFATVFFTAFFFLATVFFAAFFAAATLGAVFRAGRFFAPEAFLVAGFFTAAFFFLVATRVASETGNIRTDHGLNVRTKQERRTERNSDRTPAHHIRYATVLGVRYVVYYLLQRHSTVP